MEKTAQEDDREADALIADFDIPKGTVREQK
jgi:hypothetical protein